MVKGVIFDAGGVIHYAHPSKKDIARAFRVSMSQINEAIKKPLELFRIGKIDEEEFWQKFSDEIGLPVPKNKERLWRDGFKKNFRLFSEIIELVKELKKQGVKTAVLSNTIKPHLEIAEKFGTYRFFDVVVLSCLVGLSKPHQEIYQYTLEKLGLKPEECFYVDNLEENLKPARKMGMKTMLVNNPPQLAKKLSDWLKNDSKVDQLSAAIVLVAGDKVLLQLRDEKPDIVLPGCWCIPGGGVNEGEDVKTAAQRELKEETAYISKDPKLFLVETYQLPSGKTVKRHLFYEIYDGKQKIKCLEGQKMEFRSPKDFKKMKLYPGHKEIIKKAVRLAKRRTREK